MNDIQSDNHQAKRHCGRHEFDLMKPSKSSRIVLAPVNAHNIKTGWELVNQEIPGEIACISTIEKIIEHNSDNVLLFCRDNKIIGIWAMLMLSATGLEELLVGELKATKPPLKSLAPKGVAPQAIYIWAAVAPGLSAGGVMQVSRFLSDPLFRHANCYSRPNTPAGEKFNVALGFKPVNCGTPGLYRYVRLANRSDELQQAA